MQGYNQDKELHADSVSNAVTRQRWLRIFILVLQLAPILRFTDALIYALKARRAEKKKDESTQRMYYGLMLKEDSDAALLRIFECFLEAAPQQVLQTSLLFRHYEDMKIHQLLSICSSILGMGWCLAAYQRAVRFTHPDKLNMNWLGSVLQVIWHFLVTLSRITSISIIAYLFPHWTILACFIHIFVMAVSIQLFDHSPFCSNNKLGEVAFSFALGAVYLFTYILPVEARTRYRYSVYYSVCFLQNVACAVVWYIYVDDTMKSYLYFDLVLIFCIVPFVLGQLFMVVYYMFFHPTVRVRIRDAVTYNAKQEIAEAS
ncbi:hypothetical protein O0L34_g17751 [Tuta absoluta]|nr:hypothetical protein O0L34_g17751 [Tuta absoluta]